MRTKPTKTFAVGKLMRKPYWRAEAPWCTVLWRTGASSSAQDSRPLGQRSACWARGRTRPRRCSSTDRTPSPYLEIPMPMTAQNARLMARQFIALADEQNSRWPQYSGKFDNYVLVRIKRRVSTKMGVAFERGEWAIAEPRIRRFFDITGRERTAAFVYSSRNRISTSVPAKDIEWVEGEPETVNVEY